VVARAQQAADASYRFLNLGSPEPFSHSLSAFRQGLGEAGYVEGRMSQSNTAGRRSSMTPPELAADLVSPPSIVIVAAPADRRSRGQGRHVNHSNSISTQAAIQ